MVESSQTLPVTYDANTVAGELVDQLGIRRASERSSHRACRKRRSDGAIFCRSEYSYAGDDTALARQRLWYCNDGDVDHGALPGAGIGYFMLSVTLAAAFGPSLCAQPAPRSLPIHERFRPARYALPS